MLFCFSFRFNYQFQVQIHSRHGSHSVTYSDPWYSSNTLQTLKSFCYSFIFKFSYNSDMLQTQKPFCYSFRFSLQIQLRYVPDTDTILILTTYNSTNILGWHLQAHLQQDSITSPNGIFKHIPSATLCRVQIYGHSSVQSSFTFRHERKNSPI